MVEAVSKYNVLYERGTDGWWTATVRGVRGCHTQGRSIEQAENRIREALGLYVDDAERAELVRQVRLPRRLRELVTGVLRLESRERRNNLRDVLGAFPERGNQAARGGAFKRP